MRGKEAKGRGRKLLLLQLLASQKDQIMWQVMARKFIMEFFLFITSESE
jgi:hypothetical protein